MSLRQRAPPKSCGRHRPSNRGITTTTSPTPTPITSTASSKTVSMSGVGAEASRERAPLLAPQSAKNARADPRRALSPRHGHVSQHRGWTPTTRVTASEDDTMENLSRKSQWIVLAVVSGACAAFNGVFAKLTTTELTTSFATWVANRLGFSNVEGAVEVVVRAIFFGLNLIFNGIMWALFTKALARGTSTTQVSIINTSSNFMVTAVMGALIFSEKLPPLWFGGAALLVAGNVIIGRREEGEKDKDAGDIQHESAENGEGRYAEEEELLGDEVELDEDIEERERERKRNEEDILDLGSEDDEETTPERQDRI